MNVMNPHVIRSCVFRYKGQAPDLLGKQDSVYEGDISFEFQ